MFSRQYKIAKSLYKKSKYNIVTKIADKFQDASILEEHDVESALDQFRILHDSEETKEREVSPRWHGREEMVNLSEIPNYERKPGIPEEEYDRAFKAAMKAVSDRFDRAAEMNDEGKGSGVWHKFKTFVLGSYPENPRDPIEFLDKVETFIERSSPTRQKAWKEKREHQKRIQERIDRRTEQEQAQQNLLESMTPEERQAYEERAQSSREEIEQALRRRNEERRQETTSFDDRRLEELYSKEDAGTITSQEKAELRRLENKIERGA